MGVNSTSNRHGGTSTASFVGVLPGPRTGMTQSTQEVLDALECLGDVRRFDIGRSYHRSGLAWRIQKAKASLLAVILVFSWKPRGAEALYLSGNSGFGLWYNVAQVLAGRARGFRIFFHHHVYDYVQQPTWAVRTLLKSLGSDTTHVFPCAQMADDFDAAYDVKVRRLICIPAVVEAKPARAIRRPPGAPFVIGLLSNLTYRKGVREAIEVVERLSGLGHDVELRLAGPLGSGLVAAEVHAAAERSELVEWVGPVFGGEKQRFFGQLDAFVFPSVIESWGIVVDEALSAGVPVVSRSVACLPSMIGDGGYCVTGPAWEFVDSAVACLVRWISDRELYEQTRARAAARGLELEREGANGLTALCNEIMGTESS